MLSYECYDMSWYAMHIYCYVILRIQIKRFKLDILSFNNSQSSCKFFKILHVRLLIVSFISIEWLKVNHMGQVVN